MPSMNRSEENANSPFTLGGPSGRRALSPTPRARRLRVKVAGRLGAGMGALLLGLAEGGEDPAVAGAPAQVARDGLPHLHLGRLDVAVEQVGQGDDHAGDAESTLDGT